MELRFVLRWIIERQKQIAGTLLESPGFIVLAWHTFYPRQKPGMNSVNLHVEVPEIIKTRLTMYSLGLWVSERNMFDKLHVV